MSVFDLRLQMAVRPEWCERTADVEKLFAERAATVRNGVATSPRGQRLAKPIAPYTGALRIRLSYGFELWVESFSEDSGLPLNLNVLKNLRYRVYGPALLYHRSPEFYLTNADEFLSSPTGIILCHEAKEHIEAYVYVHEALANGISRHL